MMHLLFRGNMQFYCLNLGRRGDRPVTLIWVSAKMTEMLCGNYNTHQKGKLLAISLANSSPVVGSAFMLHLQPAPYGRAYVVHKLGGGEV